MTEPNPSELPIYPKMRGLDFSENSNPLGPPDSVREVFLRADRYLNVYPDYKNVAVNAELARFHGVDVDTVTICNGSLEAIFALPRLLDSSRPGLMAPTYWGFEAGIRNQGKECDKVFFDRTLEFPLVELDALAGRSTILYLCNPNNPTSSYLCLDHLLPLVRNNPGCHFVVDESHLLLHEEYRTESLAPFVEQLGNVSLVYSLSKFFAVAGFRVGTLISCRRVVEAYRNWQVPYSLNTIAQACFPVCLRDADFITTTRRMMPVLVRDLCEALAEFEWLRVVPSRTNFVLTELLDGTEAVALHEDLESRGIFVRELTRSYPGIPGEWVRISVGRPEAHRRLVAAMRESHHALSARPAAAGLGR